MAAPNLEVYSRRARTLKYGTNVLLGVLLFAVILVTINYIAYRRPVQFDLTRGNQYTVSEATRSLLKGLKDQVTVTVYASRKEIPADWNRQLSELETLLKQYRNMAGPKLKYSIKNPSANKDVEEEARKAGIREQQMQQVDVKEASFALGFLGFNVQYRGKTETVPVIKPDSPLEYQLTRALNKVAEVNIPTIAILSPQGNPLMGEQGPFSSIPEILQQEGYSVKTLEPGNLTDLTSDVQLVMAFEPENLSEEALYRLDQHVMNGGKLFVAAGGVKIEGGGQGQRGGGMRGTANPPNVNSILEHYGVRINGDIVEDWSQGVEQTMLTQRGIIRTRNPFLIEVTDLNSTSPVTERLPGLAMVYPSTVSRSQHETSATYTYLARSSAKSKRQSEFFVLDPMNRALLEKRNEGDLQPFDLIASVSGKLNSRFASVDPPALTNDDQTTRAVLPIEVKRTSDKETQVVVASSGVSFMDQIIAQGSPVNAVFLLNVADSLTRGGQYLALRSKQQNISFLRDFDQSEAITAQVLVLTVVPLLVIAFGLVKFSLSRARRSRYRSIYANRPPAAQG